MEYADAEAVFSEISRVTPSYARISYPRIDADGLVWPCPTKDHPGTSVLHVGKFTSGLGKFHVVEFLPPAETPDDNFPFTLTTGRLLYHYHTGTMTMRSDDLNERAPECRIEIADSDASRLGVANGEMLSIRSRRGTIQARATLTPSIMPGTVFIPFHLAAAAANRLTHAGWIQCVAFRN